MEGDTWFGDDRDENDEASSGSGGDDEDSGSEASFTNLSDHDRQLAELQQLENTIQKETYHVIPIMESRQGFTNLAANVQRISQAGRDAVDWGRACLQDAVDARAEADRAVAEERALQAEVADLRDQLASQERQTAASRAEADASHGREQETLVLLEELRAEVTRLRARADALALQQDGEGGEGGGRQDASDLDTRHRVVREQHLAEELAHVRELLRSTYNDQDTIARRASFANLRATQLAEDLSAAQAAHALEVRHKENLEVDIKNLRQDFDARGTEIDGLQTVLDSARDRIDLLEKMLRDAAGREDRLRKRAEQLQRVVDRSEQRANGLQQMVDQRKQGEDELRAQLHVAELEVGRQRRKVQQLEKARDAAATKVRQMDARTAALQADRDAQLAENADLRRELETLRDEAAAAERRATQLAARNAEMESRRHRLSRVADQQARVLRSKQKLWDDLSREYALCRKRARQDETAKERLLHEKEHLAACLADKGMRCEVLVEDQRLKDLKLAAVQREMAESAAAQLKLAAQLDGIRGQLAAAQRDLAEQRERTQDASAKMKALDEAHEQLKEEAATKEKQTAHLERLLTRARTETHRLRADVQRLEATAAALRSEGNELAADMTRLADVLRKADADRAALRRESAAHLDERDVIATMLVRRNDEVALLRNKERLLEESLVRGRRTLVAHQEDVRLLKLEVRRLRGERHQLGRHVSMLPGLRAELHRAVQDLTFDRVRLRALEDEMSCPLNVHRWRKLEGSDPATHELLLKVHILQKRILRMSSAALRREAHLRRTEHLYAALRRAVCPSEGMPAPHGVPRHMRLAARGRHLKALIAEVSALEAMADQKVATRLLADVDVRKRKAPVDGQAELEAPRAKLVVSARTAGRTSPSALYTCPPYSACFAVAAVTAPDDAPPETPA